MRKMLELNEKNEILSLYSVILLLHPHFPCLSLLFWLHINVVCTSLVS